MREPEERVLRTLDGKVRAYLSTRYRIRDNYDLMSQAVLPALHEAGPETMQVLSSKLTELRMYIKVLFPDVTFTPPDGQDLHGGIIIGNSEVGAGALFVEPFMYRSFCLNGMVFGTKHFDGFGLRKAHHGRMIDADDTGRVFSDETLRKEDEAFFAMAHDLIAHAATGIQFKAITDMIEAAAGIRPGGNPVQAVERLQKREQLRDGEKDAIMQHLIGGGDLTAWGYANAVTRAARTVENYDRQVELERLGADLLTVRPAEWKQLAAAA
jgi:hypothetical protein